jgi:hypothetical protein
MKTTDMESRFAEVPVQRNPCHNTAARHSFALGVIADDGHEYFFGTTQFIDAELTVDAAVEESENAPPERLHLRYVTGEAVILGRGLRRLAQSLQCGELENVRPLARRYAGVRCTGPIISSIVVTRKEVV